MKTKLNAADKRDLTTATQIAGSDYAEPSVWERLGKYFRERHSEAEAMVQPRQVRDTTRPL